MKNAISIFLIQFFLISNSGMAVSVHFCGGKLASIDFFSDGGHNCKCGKRTMKPNCCKDNELLLKANNELVKTNYFTFKNAAPKFLFYFPVVITNLLSDQSLFVAADFYHPPLYKPKSPIYLLDRVILI